MVQVTVLMPAWNAARFLGEAVLSIVRQDHEDWELVAVDDGSTDETPAILAREAARDRRIHVLTLPHLGTTAALNRGLAAARGELVARMDADDVAEPDRLITQLDFLARHPACVAVGSAITVIDEDGDRLGYVQPPASHEEIVRTLLSLGGYALPHPTIMFRRAAADAIGGYDERLSVAQDVDFVLRLSDQGRLANLALPLLRYRRHPTAVTTTRRSLQARAAWEQIVAACHARGLPPPPGPDPTADLYPPLATFHLEAMAHARSGGETRARLKHGWRALRSAPTSRRVWRRLLELLRD